MIVLIVSLAVYVSGGQLLASTLGGYRDGILRELNAHLPFKLEAQSLSGEWQSFTPVIVLSGLRLSIPGSSNPPLELAQGRIGLDVLNSLRTGALQLNNVMLSGLDLRGELTATGSVRLSGLGEGSGDATGPLREFLLNVERVSLQHNHLQLTMPSGEVRDLELDLNLSRDGSQRRVQAILASTAGAHIEVIAKGLGDPFRPEDFTGNIYLHIQTAHLGAMQAMFANRAPTVWADGTADLELWLDWDRGQSAIATRFAGSDLVVTTPNASTPLPLQRVAFEAKALRSNDDWTVFFQNVQIGAGEAAANIPRLQLDLLGDTLRLRTAAVELAPVAKLLAQQQAIPQDLREVIAELQPQGALSALQVQLGDLDNPFAQWELAANFEDLTVEPWQGAPGIRAATGYARLTPGTGLVILDSPGLSLDFPTVYQQPLRYQDMYGSLALNWDSEVFHLRSGLLTTQGEEGSAKVLFSLAVPLQHSEVGIEMDLLVGLQDSSPKYRDKYIPYILDQSLRDWLTDSIGDGRIEQGAFLWRGSLNSHATELRTVQLAFNVADTQLAFDPRWPPLLVQQGIVLIDDSDVSVWAERANLLASTAQQVSVETRVNAAGHLTLDLRGGVHGPAADGFRVLNESPLADVVGPSFSAWKATGKLDTDLDLHLDLTDTTAAPQVNVLTQWHDVDILLTPGNLPLQRVNGKLAFSTSKGFSSRGLVGELWGKTVKAKVREQLEEGSDHYDPATSAVQIYADTAVDIADLRRWLRLDSLAFANGVTPAKVDIQLARGTAPQLAVSSDLQGVELDIPQPWHKESPEAWPFHLQLPLQQGSMPLQLALEQQQLAINLDVADGMVRGGSIGIAATPSPVQPGDLRVTGHAPLVQVDEWFDFVSRYYGSNLLQILSGAGTTDDAAGAKSSDATHEPPASAPLSVFIDDLQTDELVVLQQPLRDVRVDLASQPERWQLSLTSDWVAAELSVMRGGQPSRLEISHLDLDHLPAFQPTAGSGDSQWNLPTVAVSVADLSQSGKRLGALSFDLDTQDNVVTASNISGELAHLNIRPGSPGRLLWHRGQTPYTELQSGFEFGDLGQTLEYFGYQRIVQTEHGEFDLQLRWPGAPQDFSLAQAEGSLLARIGSGSFLDATAGASGALRVVSILNLADIVRRLSVSAMFESGIPFDSVEGAVDLSGGVLKVARMEVTGGSSFQFSGESDVRTRTVTGEMVAKLPVAQNLPWMAAFAASLPVVAGVYVISQVFDKQMNRLASAVYTIGGTWNDPTVTFDRIFDNTPEETPEPAATGQSSSP
jgi:uncharacterized protein (TIGR02099 family)